MKKFSKGMTALLLGVCLSLSAAPKVFAKTDIYLIKDSSAGIVYEYDKAVLEESLLNYTLNGSDVYYEEFAGKRAKYSIYAFHSDGGKYVDFKVACDALIDYTLNGQDFNLNTFMDMSSTPALEIKSPIKTVGLENGQVEYVDKSEGEPEGDALEIISIE